MTDETQPSAPRPIYDLIPLMAGVHALAEQVRALGEDLREADRQISYAASLHSPRLRALTALRDGRHEFVADLGDRLENTTDLITVHLRWLANHGLVTLTDGSVAITEPGRLLEADLYAPLIHGLADCMRPHTIATLEAVKSLITAWQEAIRQHVATLRALPADALDAAHSA